MKTIQISECKERVGSVIGGVTGIIQKIFPRKTGETVKNGKKFNWSIQNGELSDDTGIIRFSLFGVDEMPQTMKGKQVTFLSTQGRGGLNGVFVNVSEYKDKKYLELKIDKNAQFMEGSPKEAFEGNTMGSQSDNAGMPVQTSKPQQNAPQVNSERNKAVSVEDRIVQYRTLYALCARNADTVIKECDFSEEDYREITTTFFIQAVKEGLVDRVEDKDEIPF